MSAAGGLKDTVKKEEENTKEKEDVLCKYCDKVMRKDKVGKHFETERRKERRHVSNTLQQELLALESSYFFTSSLQRLLISR